MIPSAHWHISIELDSHSRRICLRVEQDGHLIPGAPLEVWSCKEALGILMVWSERERRGVFHVTVCTDGQETVRVLRNQHLALYFIASMLEQRTATLETDAYAEGLDLKTGTYERFGKRSRSDQVG